jgi:hypothetical protein
MNRWADQDALDQAKALKESNLAKAKRIRAEKAERKRKQRLDCQKAKAEIDSIQYSCGGMTPEEREEFVKSLPKYSCLGRSYGVGGLTRSSHSE